MDLLPNAPFRECAILIYWQLVRPNGQMLHCTSYRTATGLELRAGLKGEAPVLQADVTSHAEARKLAESWRQEITQYAAA